MRKMCKRKHYAKVDPIALAIAGATIASAQDLDKLRMRELSAIESFRAGTGTPSDFRDIADMLNLAQTMGEMGIGPEVLPVCEAVESQLLRAKAQHDEQGRMTLTALGLKALRDLFEFHDLQRTSVDRSAYERAIQKTRNRIRSSHPDVKELI